MRKSIILFLIGLFVFTNTFVSCEAATKPEKRTYEVIKEKEFIDVTKEDDRLKWIKASGLIKELDFAKTEDFKKFEKDYQDFSNKTFMQLSKQGNLVYSPLSAYLPLEELRKLTNKDSKVEKELRELLRKTSFGAKKDLSNTLNVVMTSDGYLVNTSIWLGTEAKPKIENIKAKSWADIFKVDFKTVEAVEKQLQWINKWTKGSFKDNKESFTDSSTVNKELAVRLLGTTYLKLNWKDEYFNEIKDTFHNEDKSKKEIDFIQTRNYESFQYFENKSILAVRVPLKNGQNFIVFLPKEKIGLSDTLTKENLNSLYNSTYWKEADVKLTMPKLKSESSIDLKESLQEIGLSEIFTAQKAYYDLLGTEVGEIGAIQQETKVSIDDKGFEGASFTKVDMMKMSAMIPEEKKKIELKIDKPYGFIVLNENIPTFMGLQRNF